MDITIIQLFFVVSINFSFLSLLITGCVNKIEEKSNKKSKSKSKFNKSKKQNDIYINTTILSTNSSNKPKAVPNASNKSKKETLLPLVPVKKQPQQNIVVKPQKSCSGQTLPVKNKEGSVKSLTSTQSTSSKFSTNSFSLSNPVKLNTQEKSDQRKKLKLEKNLKEWQSKNYQQILVTLNKSELRWDDGTGGLQNVNLENPSRDRVAVKIKCSDNILYRVNPVYTIIEPEERITIDILRDAGTQKTDKLVFVLSKVDSDIKDAQVYYSGCPKRQQMLVLPLIGASAVY
uniref:Major sperm protein n=1 Tax=Strongyloides venezuelensis TaxID=75913 RepID=A0A0K0FKF8_STRVS